MKSSSAFYVGLVSLLLFILASCATPPRQIVKGAAQPDRWAALWEQAGKGPLAEPFGEQRNARRNLAFRPEMVAEGPASDLFEGSYRAEAKTSFAAAAGQEADIGSLISGLPSDKQMARLFPNLLPHGSAGNHETRVALERRNVRVNTWIYWVQHEGDNDFHVVLGDTSELSSGTTFMNAEISGLPSAHPDRAPFVALRHRIEQLLANHENRNGLLKTPVAVTIKGSLLWDGEHTYPSTVGPKGLPKLRQAWEIHPIHDLAVRN
jgi:hypothetical protein